MRVLVACEYSGRVRDAFTALGHDAMSCDILESDSPGSHYRGNVLDVIGAGWDLMVAHPPCTYLSNSGVHWLGRQEGRWGKMEEAAAFFGELLDADIPKICVENPVMHGHGKKIIGCGQATQIVQPWMFGHPQKKATCLWLKGLPKLTPSSDAREEMERMTESEKQRIDMDKRQLKRAAKHADRLGIRKAAIKMGVSYSTLRAELGEFGYVSRPRGRPTGDHAGAVKKTAFEFRRKRVAYAMRRGKTSVEIAVSLGVSERTARYDIAQVRALEAAQ